MELATRSLDLEQYKDTIISLRHDHSCQQLDKKIRQLQPNLTGSTGFLIKMEIKRLAQVISRVIDLRDMCKESCEQFEYQGVIHSMDPDGIRDFKKEVKRYQGNYTLGVYEFVIGQARKRYRENPNQHVLNNLPAAEISSLVKFHQRHEERLYFASKVTVFSEDPANLSYRQRQEMGIPAITTDISADGVSVKVIGLQALRLTEQMYLWFYELEQEFSFGLPLYIPYQQTSKERKDDATYFKMQLNSESDSPVLNEFGRFISQQLLSQKRAYRVPVENTIEAIQVKADEQFIISRLHSLPVYLTNHQETWYPRALFHTKNNQPLSAFLMLNQMPGLLTSFCRRPELQNQLHEGLPFRETYFLLRIIDQQKRLHLAAIPYFWITTNHRARQLLKRVNPRNIRLIQVDGCSLDSEHQAHIPSSLPDSAGEAFETLNRKPNPRALSIANRLQRMLVLTDISDSMDRLQLFDVLSQKGSEENEFKLSEFLLRNQKSDVELSQARAETNDLRAEDRFDCRLSLKLTARNSAKMRAAMAITSNISTRGLCVEFDSPHSFKRNDDIYVDFLNLPSINGGVLPKQTYRIVHAGEKSIRATISGNTVNHEGRKGLRAFIYKNLSKLQQTGCENEVYGLSRVLRNLYASNHLFPYLLTSKTSQLRHIRNIALSEKSLVPRVHPNIDAEQGIIELTQNEVFRSLVFRQLQTVNRDTPYAPFYILVIAKQRTNKEINVIVRHLDEIKDAGKLRMLLASLETLGQPYIIRVNATKKGRVFNKYIRDELAYLSRFSNVKYQDCLGRLRDTTGIVDISDVTDLLL